MIITCNKCSTRFTLDDSFVKETGSKVRCSVCKHIFTTYPLIREPEQTYAPVEDFDSEPALDDIPDFEMEDSDFSLKDSDLEPDLEIESRDLVLEDSEFTPRDLEQEDTDFSFEEDEFELDTGDDEKTPDDKDFEFEPEDISEDITINEPGDDESGGIDFEPMTDEPGELMLSMEEGEPGLKIEEEEFELEFDVEEDSTGGLSGTPDEAPLDIMQEGEEETLTLESDDSKEDLDEIKPEDDFSEYDEVLDQETEPEEQAGDETLGDEEPDQAETIKEQTLIEKTTPLMDLPERRSRRKKKPLLSLPVLLLLLIFFLTAGAYIASIMTGYKVPHLSDINIPFLGKYLNKTDPAAMNAKPVPNENSVNGRFVSNSTSGTLFVITGRVDNPSTFSFKHIEVQGTLSTKEIPAAQTKKAFCGNIITEEMLKSGSLADMIKLLEVREGAHNSNAEIKPGAGVPFMIVFSDLPEKLQNFNVKVVGFEKATGN